MTWSAKDEPPMPMFDFGPRSHPRPGEDSYIVEIADLSVSPSVGGFVGPFLEKDQAEAWRPGKGQLIVAIRPLSTPLKPPR